MAGNGNRRLDRLFAAARGVPPDTSRAEEGFENRVAARVRGARPGKGELPVGAWAWRLSPLFAAAMLSVAVWTAVTVPDFPTGPDLEVAASWDADEMADFLGGDG